MRSARNPAIDHGAALRVPPAHDAANWRKLRMWLGDDGRATGEAGAVEVRTPDGPGVARPGDWIVLSAAGAFHVAHAAHRAGRG
ncbi:hypothetical protein [Phenylobacterium sp.]|uniref:hypothetical protein n=1 Tax=Phenylobacterium sp. TaxID=1871053 RepID=UPI002F40E47F